MDRVTVEPIGAYNLRLLFFSSNCFQHSSHGFPILTSTCDFPLKTSGRETRIEINLLGQLLLPLYLVRQLQSKDDDRLVRQPLA
jgi:hypothetical protein